MNFKKIGSRGGKNTTGDSISLEILFKNSELNISARILCKDSKGDDALNDSLTPQISSVSFTFLSHGFSQKPFKPGQIDEGQPWCIHELPALDNIQPRSD